VKSALGQGTTFYIDLPLTSEGRESSQLSGPPARESSTILLVEDQPALARLLQEALIRIGYRVILAEDGAMGLQLAEQNLDEIDLVVTDMVMPKLGGRALIEKLRQRKPDLGAVLISGYTSALQESESTVLGERCVVLQKPFPLSKLREAIFEALGTDPSARRIGPY
jgi:two-component system cell cycle sensor histidine kinase/response regulator CckA